MNVYVLLSVSLPSLLRRRSCVCECVCPSVSEPSKLTSSKVIVGECVCSSVSEPSKFHPVNQIFHVSSCLIFTFLM